MGLDELPEMAREKIRILSEKTGIAQTEILREYEEIISDPFIREDPQFKSEDDRQRYAVMVLWARYIGRPPVKEYDIVPIGLGPLRVTRSSGLEMTNIFALVKTPSGTRLKRIVLRGEMTEKRKEIALFLLYKKVKLGEFSSGDLIADNRARFDNPVKVNVNPAEILDTLGVKRCNIASAKNHLSRVGSDGYVDSTDWRIIRGIIIRANKFSREDGSEGGVYTIIDETVEDEPKVMPDGSVQRPGFTVWVAPELMNYGEESECDFVGTLQLGKSGNVFMNAYLILPIHVRRTVG